MSKLLVIIGSTRPTRSADLVQPWLTEKVTAHPRFETEVADLRDWPLPMFQETLATIGDRANPTYSEPIVKAWNDKVREGDAYLFITPEYNHSISGVLKNAIDNVFVSHAFRNKVAAFCSYSGALVGGARAVEHLAHEVDELALSGRADVEEDGDQRVETAAVPGDRGVPCRNRNTMRRGRQTVGGVVAERLQRAADEGRHAAAGRLVQLAVEPEQGSRLGRELAGAGLAGDARHERVVAEARPVAVVALDALRDARALGDGQLPLGVDAPGRADRLEAPGLRQRIDEAAQEAAACFSIAATAARNPLLVSDDPATRETESVPMSLPTTCDATPSANIVWYWTAFGSVACLPISTSVTLSSARVSVTVIVSVPLGA